MSNAEKGSGLIVVILVVAFLLSAGLTLVSVTGSGPRVSGNVRNQEEAFNAAEAGFEASRQFMESQFADGTWTSFEAHYVEQPIGINLPADANYFRRLKDEELLSQLSAATPNIIFYNQPFVATQAGANDPRFTYTAFLINNEAGGGTPDPKDALLVSIGIARAGARILATSRLEIVLAFQNAGTNP